MSKVTKDRLPHATELLHLHGLSVETREIYLHGWLDIAEETEEPGLDYRSATKFIKNLHFLQNQSNDDIVIHQHTIGGEWNEGVAIYDAIKASPCHITMIAHAHARSMSSITIQAADERLMMPNADFMVHYGDLALEGGETGVLSEADWSKHLDQKMLNIYALSCVGTGEFFRGKKIDYVSKYIDRQMKDKTHWYMTSSEAVNYGFVDGVV